MKLDQTKLKLEHSFPDTFVCLGQHLLDSLSMSSWSQLVPAKRGQHGHRLPKGGTVGLAFAQRCSDDLARRWIIGTGEAVLRAACCCALISPVDQLSTQHANPVVGCARGKQERWLLPQQPANAEGRKASTSDDDDVTHGSSTAARVRAARCKVPYYTDAGAHIIIHRLIAHGDDDVRDGEAAAPPWARDSPPDVQQGRFTLQAEP